MLDELFAELIEVIKKYHPAEKFDKVREAYELAKEAHGQQFRKSGEPYLIHPIAVAKILAEIELDKESIIAALLHDVVEDTDYTIEDIQKMFGPEVALLVNGVTKLGEINYTGKKEDIQAENYRKMFMAMAKDIRVILIKLADRLHNLRTLIYMPEHKQKKKAKETLDIYAPLANRLGISKIKVEMEDLALKYLDKEAYYAIVNQIKRKRSDRENYINEIVDSIDLHLQKEKIDGQVYGRPKHFFSIYKKMVNQHKTLDEIYDLFAVRVLVPTVKDCYTVFGEIHDMYTPVPGRFKDYIAMPKPNNYQSIHTTVIGPEGEPFEVQIRTFEMHKIAEYGIAAHWKYKEGNSESSLSSEEEKLNWLRQILQLQKDVSDNKEYLELIKDDLNIFDDRVYAFTPSGDIINLPVGSTPVDFAYSIHTAVGNKMVGARVDGKIVTFDYLVKNGERIEIITSQNSKGPSRDWLNIVKSSQAKTKINQWFKKQLKEENIARGNELLEHYAKNKEMPYKQMLTEEGKNAVYRKYGFRTWDAVCATVGHGGLKEGQIINKLYTVYNKAHQKAITTEEIIKEIEEKANKVPKRKSKTGITVKGLDGIAVRLSKCCTPVPGDEIIGFVTRGRGVTVHRTDCDNIINLTGEERSRLVEVEWPESHVEATYNAEISILTEDRTRLLVDISETIANEGVYTIAMSTKAYSGEAHFNFTIKIKSGEQLDTLLKKLRGIKGVYEVRRNNSK